jgi:RNA polymerase sigma-70 factor (ECF subfamily)
VKAAQVDEAAPAGGGAPALENLEQHLPYLFRYAMAHVRDPDLAQDAVQETLLAALKGGSRFEGRSAVRSWLTAILKHKLADLLRARAREAPLDDSDLAADAADDDAFLPDGHWRNAPAEWGDPDRALEQRRFWEAFERCSQALPERTAQVFALREIHGASVQEICEIHGITESNCWVLLHRARRSLRACLEKTWFRGDA